MDTVEDIGRIASRALCVLALACTAGMALPGRSQASAATIAATHASDAMHLIEAVRQGRGDLVRQLVDSGADVDARAPGDGTALIVAAKRGDRPMVDALIALGADAARACPGDGNPLIAAAAGGHVEVLDRLLSAGARIDAIVPGDETALIAAVRADRLPAVRFLVGHGANVNLGAMSERGQWRTPLNQAGSGTIRRFLRGAGATPDGALRNASGTGLAPTNPME